MSLEGFAGDRSAPRRPHRGVIVLGGANTDYTVRGPRLPTRKESEVQGREFLEAPGGKGLNQAIAATRLGAEAALIACVGTDERAHVILEHLARDRVEARHVVRNAETSTGATVIQVDLLGNKQTMSAPGANLYLGVRDVRRAGMAVRTAQVLLVQLEPPLPAIVEAVRIARAAGVPVILDAGPRRPLPDSLLREVAIIRANAEEAELLTGVHVTGRPSARRAGKALLARGVGAAAIEANDRGDLIIWRDGECWLPHLKVQVVDATGAGDAFTACLLVSLLEGGAEDEALRRACAAGALAASRFGAQPSLPTAPEVDAILARG